MASDKKPSKSTPEDQALEERVKAMMDPAAPDPAPVPAAAPADHQPPPLDIFSGDPKTAPAVPAKLLQKIGAAVSRTSGKKAAQTPAPSKTSPPEPVPPAGGEPEPATEPSAPERAVAETVAPAEPLPETAEPSPAAAQSTPLDDSDTDKAVDDIAVNESDAVLAAEDAANQQSTPVKAKPARQGNIFKRLLTSKWSWLVLILLIGGLLGYPMTRYKVLGLVLRESVSITVTDSKSDTPVSNATVRLDGRSVKTNANGKAALRVPPGTAALTVTKQYYKSFSGQQAVGLRSGKKLHVQLVATGRQVPVSVRNLITGKPLAGAEISVLDTTAQTNSQGQATIVLPTTAASDKAAISLNGYNTASFNIAVTSVVVSANTVSLTPAGHVYFLSNASGTIDVVKTNLDGSGRKTVLAGTGKEDPNTTSLLASRDWQYLVLKAQRDSSGPALYLINTSTDKTTEIDSGNADFTLIGWSDHSFVYDVVHNSVPAWQNAHETLKSYNADTGQPELLDQDQAEGTSTDYAYQGFYNFYTLNDLIVYNTQWYTYNASGAGYDLSSKSDTIRAVQPNGLNKKDYQSVPASGLGYIQAALFEPQNIYYAVYNYNTNATTYYKFADETVSTLSSLSQTTFNQTYPTYLVSPSGNHTFWTEPRDGQNGLFVGDLNGQNQQQIGTVDGFNPYGWYSDRYVLLSKDSSQLYIMPAGGLSTGQQPLKISDYYKPTQTYSGYGYGYGGL